MDKLLIVNADDFGLCKAQNYGIIDAFTHGVVSSTTAMVNQPGAEHAAQLSAANPQLPVGMHFVLTLGKPLTEMPGLVRDNGELGKWIWEMAEAGTLPLDQIKQELAAQFARFIELFGRKPTHIDSHHHVHMIPQIFPIVEAFAQQQDVAMRIDRDAIQQHNIPLCGARSTAAFDSTFYGDSITEELFLSILDHANQRGDHSLEIMCHPSFIDNTILSSKYCYPRLAELDVLTSVGVKAGVGERGWKLGGFGNLD